MQNLDGAAKIQDYISAPTARGLVDAQIKFIMDNGSTINFHSIQYANGKWYAFYSRYLNVNKEIANGFSRKR